jgi:O-antigen/teichoic acid export membrane protein
MRAGHQQDLHRGFSWLGGAMVVGKVVDFGTILIVLLYLTKQQVGIASLVVAIGTVIEALDGLGASTALVQARSLSPLQLDSLFWFITGAALLVGGLTLLAAPGFAALYGVTGMATYFLAVALKQPLVGAAVIPLAILSRELQYERIAIVNVCATLAAALTRVGLAVWGAGAWAIVAPYAASGLYTLIGALLARPFLPGLRLSMPAILPLIGFGLRAATTTLFEQVFNNVGYLLVGWFYGAAPLAVYRVAFDVAMQPATAWSTLVNRTALPVFAQVAAVREQLAQALGWSLRRLMIVVSPLAVGTVLAAQPIATLIHDGQGRSYAAAGLPLALLAAAAALRVMSQLMYPLVLATGRPRTAVRLSAATLLLSSAGMLIVGCALPSGTGIIGISVVWLTVYPLLLIWSVRFLRRHWNIRAGDLARTLLPAFVSTAVLVSIVELARLVLARLVVGDGNPWLRIAVVTAAVVLTYVGLLRCTRRELSSTAK